MINHPWCQQTVLVCVDRYENGVPQGQLYLPGQGGERFESLSQLLLRAERLLNQEGGVQSFTTPRIFALAKPLPPAPCDAGELTRGSAATDPDTRRRWVEEARRIAGEAADRGLTVAFEYHPGTLTDSAASARRLMEEVDHPAARLYWQPDFSKPEEELLAGLDTVLPFVEMVHVFTWRPDGTRLPLSCGQDFWMRALNRFPNLEKKKLLLEFLPGDDPALLPREAETLRQMESEVLNHE